MATNEERQVMVPPPTAVSRPMRPGRALMLLGVFFVVGGLAGAALDRVYVNSKAPHITNLDSVRFALTQQRERERREQSAGSKEPGGGAVEAERIPTPLERLNLTEEEKSRLRNIARRWRPQAAKIVESIRAQAGDIENGMFAEMMCVLTPEQRRQYAQSMTENDFGRSVIDKRMSLVLSNGCAKVPETK